MVGLTLADIAAMLASQPPINPRETLMTATHTERDGFTYSSDCASETDPATMVSVVAGDRISVVDSIAPVYYWQAERKPRTFVVERVCRDEFGLYFYGADGQYANTIINQIYRAD